MADRGDGSAKRDGGDRRATTVAAVLGVLIAAASLGWTVYSSPRSDGGGCFMELIGERGMPVDAEVVGPRGEFRRPDVRGVAELPCRWEGSSVSLRELANHREMQTILVTWTGGRQRVVVGR
jgi:hypothetical protein